MATLTPEGAARHIEERLAPVAGSRGLDLVAVEIAGAREHPLVRVFLDRQGGIGIDALAEANAWISEALDEAEAVSGPYVLEVSSPGVDRRLRTPSDFERFVGEDVVVKTAAPVEGRRRFTGTLEAIDGAGVVLRVEEERYSIPFDDIAKANLRGRIDSGDDEGEVSAR